MRNPGDIDAIGEERHGAASATFAALDERHRLARELHDSACQQLFSMSLHIRAAELGLPGDRPADAATRRSLEAVNELALAALEDLRALIFELYPTLLHSEGLVAVVRQAAASATSRLGTTVTVTAPGERLDIDADVELDAHRLVQEALHNSVKHAEASTVSVSIGPDPVDATTLLLEVVDDGRGFDPSGATPGLGLVSMRERAERLGGRLTITSHPGAGTAVKQSRRRRPHRPHCCADLPRMVNWLLCHFSPLVVRSLNACSALSLILSCISAGSPAERM